MTDQAIVAAAPIVADMVDQLDAAIANILAGGDLVAIGGKAVAELPILAGQFALQVYKLAPAEVGVVATDIHTTLVGLAAHLRSIAAQAAAAPKPA